LQQDANYSHPESVLFKIIASKNDGACVTVYGTKTNGNQYFIKQQMIKTEPCDSHYQVACQGPLHFKVPLDLEETRKERVRIIYSRFWFLLFDMGK